jgi:hypothetical protein
MSFGRYIARSKLKDPCDKGHALHMYSAVYVFCAVHVYSAVYVYSAGHVYNAAHVYNAGQLHSANRKYDKWHSILLCERVQL